MDEIENLRGKIESYQQQIRGVDDQINTLQVRLYNYQDYKRRSPSSASYDREIQNIERQINELRKKRDYSHREMSHAQGNLTAYQKQAQQRQMTSRGGGGRGSFGRDFWGGIRGKR